MNNFYLSFSEYTDPGLYKEYLKNEIPDNIKEIALLLRNQLIHRVVLRNGNDSPNSDFKYGDMNKVPWQRLRCEDDIFPTVSSMITELFRRDERGVVINRAEKDKMILTCRFISLLMASVLKSKNIPCRVRSGFVDYFFPKIYADHWINQYYNKELKRWVTIDVDGILEDVGFDALDMPEDRFVFSCNAWLDTRQGRVKPNKFVNAGGFKGMQPILWELFYDFHCLMNYENIYLHVPSFIYGNAYKKLSERDLKEIDNLAILMKNPDDNFEKLQDIWNTNKKFRDLKGGVL